MRTYIPLPARTCLAVTGLTIVAYRVWTYVTVLFWGNTAWWRGVYADRWNHYQLGFLLLAASFVLGKRYARIKPFLSAVGAGMVIDEIADIIRLLGLYPLPAGFRDSAGDLALIAVTYVLYCLAYMAVRRDTPPDTP